MHRAAVRGADDISSEYDRMIDLNWSDSDKYFHCMAHCRATSEGLGGEAVSHVYGLGREVTDVIRKQDSWEVCQEDLDANQIGRQGASDDAAGCAQNCAIFKPNVHMPD